jgi:phosphoenolpyruvate synthase/pyruvate phosphate dikinase
MKTRKTPPAMGRPGERRVDWGHLLLLLFICSVVVAYLLDARAVSLKFGNLALIQPAAILALILAAMVLPQCFRRPAKSEMPEGAEEQIEAPKETWHDLAKGLNVSPGAAVGIIAFDADLAEKWSQEGHKVIMVRPETKPDDVHGMLAAQGILTSRGGRTSHAALVARQFGKPAVVGVNELEIDLDGRTMTLNEELVIKEGEWLSLDGTQGFVYQGQLPTIVPDFDNPYLLKLLSWADEIRTLGVWANADYPRDALRARQYGAEGIGLCRTEHMFFEPERLPIVQQMIMAKYISERNEAIYKLLPMQRSDFEGLFKAMDGRTVIIRLLDPPLARVPARLRGTASRFGRSQSAVATLPYHERN